MMNEKKALGMAEIFKVLRQKRKDAQDKRKVIPKKSFRQPYNDTSKK